MIALILIFAALIISLFLWLPCAFMLNLVSWAFQVTFTWKRAWVIAYCISFLACLSGSSKSKK